MAKINTLISQNSGEKKINEKRKRKSRIVVSHVEDKFQSALNKDKKLTILDKENLLECLVRQSRTGQLKRYFLTQPYFSRSKEYEFFTYFIFVTQEQNKFLMLEAFAQNIPSSELTTLGWYETTVKYHIRWRDGILKRKDGTTDNSPDVLCNSSPVQKLRICIAFMEMQARERHWLNLIFWPFKFHVQYECIKHEIGKNNHENNQWPSVNGLIMACNLRTGTKQIRDEFYLSTAYPKKNLIFCYSGQFDFLLTIKGFFHLEKMWEVNDERGTSSSSSCETETDTN